MSSEQRIAAGTHRARPVQIQSEEYGAVWAMFSETSKGNDQIVIQFEITGETDPDVGRRITWYGVCATPDQTRRVMESLRYCGFRGTDLAKLPDGPLENEVELVVSHEEWNGKTSARVEWVNRLGGRGPMVKSPMDDAKKRAFAAKMKGVLAGLGEVATPPPAPSANGASRAPGANDDDIPF